MKINSVILICGLFIFALIEVSLKVAAEHLVADKPGLTADQTTGAVKLADAITHNDTKVIPEIFIANLLEGILIYKNPDTALKLTGALEESVKARIKTTGDISFNSLRNNAGRAFSRLIEEIRKDIQVTQTAQQPSGYEFHPSISRIAQNESYDVLLRLAQSSHRIYDILLPELQKKFDSIQYWEKNELIPVNLMANSHLFSIAFSYDGTMLASEGDEKIIRIGDVRTAKQIKQLNKDAEFYNCKISFSPKSNKLAFSPKAGIVSIWDADTNTIVKSTKITGEAYSLAFSRDENTLAIGMNGKILLWNLVSNEQKHLYPDGKGHIFSMNFSFDGTHLVASDRGKNIRVWDTKTLELIDEIHTSFWGGLVAFSPDNETFAVADLESIIIRNIVSKQQRSINIKYNHSVAFSPDGLLLVVASSYQINFYSVATLTQIRSINERDRSVVAFSPNGKILAAALFGPIIQLWQAKSTSK